MEDCEEIWELGFEMVCVGNEYVNINFDSLVLFLTNKYFPYHLFICHWQEKQHMAGLPPFKDGFN